jgi:hypothetical protein
MKKYQSSEEKMMQHMFEMIKNINEKIEILYEVICTGDDEHEEEENNIRTFDDDIDDN